MTDTAPSGNAFEPNKPRTAPRDEAEAAIESLRQRGGVFAEAVRATRMPMALTDPTLAGNPIVFANDAFLKVSGYSMQEVLGQQPHFMTGAGTDQRDANRFREALELDRDVVVETVQYRKDGSRFLASVLLSAFKDEAGKTLYQFLSYLDVTARETAENALAASLLREAATKAAELRVRESEEKYRSLFESMDEAFALCELVRDADGRGIDYRYIELNPSLARHVGRPPETLLGRRASEVFGTVDSWLIETFRHVVDKRQSVLTEHYFAHGDRWLRINVFPRGGDKFAALYSDVTESHRTQAALRASEERQAFLLTLADALRSLSDPVQIQSKAAHVLGAHLGAGRAAYAEIDADEAHFTVHRDFTNGVESFVGRYPLEGYGAAELWANLRAGHTVHVCDAERDTILGEVDRASYAAAQIRAAAAVPLVKETRLSAVFFLHFPAPREWTADSLALVEETAERTWAAVERARAEAALRESEQRFQALFATSPAPFLVVRADPPCFTITEVNDAYLAVTMRTRKHLIGRGMFEAFPDNPNEAAANGVENLRASFKRALGSRQSDAMPVQKYDITGPDGSFEERWWSPVNSPVLNNYGEVESIIHHVNEVTEEHRAAAALRRSEERLRLIVESARDYAIFTIDTERKVETWLPGAEAVFGWTRNEIEGRPGDILFMPEDRARRVPEDEAETALRDGKAPDVRWHLHKDGHRVFIEGQSVPLFEGGKHCGFLKIGQDITERRQAESAFRESEERFRQFGAASSDILWIRNAASMQFEYVSPAFDAVYGLPREAVLAGDSLRRWLRLVEPEYRRSVLDRFKRVRDGERIVHEFRIRRPSDSALRWIRDTSFPLLDSEGWVERIGGIGHDVTEEKETADRLAVLVAELQHRTRNLMGVVRTTAKRTGETSADFADFRHRFDDRLEALARVQALLSRLGDTDRVAFDELILTELNAMNGAADRVTLSGPPGIRLRSSTVQTLAMALHELATNAMKYGALGQPTGHLAIIWTMATPTGVADRDCTSTGGKAE